MGKQAWMRCNSRWLISLIILLVIVGIAAAEDLSGLSFYDLSQNKSTTYEQGELIVRFADVQPGVQLPGGPMIIGPLRRSAIRDVISDFVVAGASVHKEFDRIVPGLTVVKLPEGVGVLNALVLFNRTANILYAEPNYKIKILRRIPNDPLFPLQWALDNIGQTGGTPDADIDAPEAWDIGRDATNIVVAVTDTGINYAHTDLRANMWINPGEVSHPGPVGPNDFNGVDDDGNGYIDDIYGYDFVNNDSDPNDDDGHGTQVAGVVGAVGSNEFGISGVCWNVKLMAVRVLGPGSTTIEAIAGIEYAVSKGANVINASWRIDVPSGSPPPQGLKDAIQAAGAHDILFVAAAGNYPDLPWFNNDVNPVYPANYDLDNIISVMATDQNDNRSSFSHYGATTVDLGAPGEDIISTYLNNTFAYGSGTSMAAPHVAGACALIKALRPAATYDQIKKIIMKSVDPTLPGLCVSGGRLNLYNALWMAEPGRVYNRTRRTWHLTIQEALDYATSNNEIIADAGHWYIENINFKGKSSRLRSGNVDNPADPNTSPTNTYISGMFGTDFVVRLDSGEGSGTTLRGFTILDGQAGSIHIYNSSPGISNCIITENNGGIYCYNAPNPTITSCQITGNSQSYGGIYCHNSSPTITSCTISGNNGGGIYCDSGSHPSISSCTITGNTSESSGGGIYCDSGSHPSISNCTITDNISEGQGGGIYMDDSSPTITNCQITDCSSDWEGGGIYMYDSSPTITDCQITDCNSYWDGGGIYCDSGSEPNISNSTIINNIAYYDGGGIYVNDASALIKNCLIVDNTVDSYDGGGIVCLDASPTITNCTFARNSGNKYDGHGGALYCWGISKPVVTDCIFSDNDDTAIYEYDISSDAKVRWCLFYNNPDGDYFDRDTGTTVRADRTVPGNILCNMKHYDVRDANDSHNFTANPMFVQGRLGDFYLSQFAAGQILDANGVQVDPNVNPGDATSPAVDAGSTNAIAIGMHIYSTRTDNYTDANGHKDFGRVDIGYHYKDPLSAVHYSLSTTVAPVGTGSISPDPAGNPHVYVQYAQVILTASPIDPCEYQFKDWEGTDDNTRRDLGASGEILRVQHNIVTMNSNKNVIAEFETIMVNLRCRVIGGNGDISPRRGQYPRGTVVQLTAIPANSANRAIWHYSDNDYSRLLNNTVTMSAPFKTDPRGKEYKEVEVEFYQPRMLDVPGDYTNIQIAIDDAHNGDIVVIAPGTYSYEPAQHPYGDTLIIDGISGKAITITSVNPDDPCVVATTVIEGRFIISNVQRDTVINGLTIRNPVLVRWFSGPTPAGAGNDGIPGGRFEGGGMELQFDASPDVRNCRFEGCYVWGGTGSNGNSGLDDRGSPGNGGWAGWARGGAVVCGYSGSPVFTNCTFIDCWARGGDGGNGADDSTWGGHGGNWEEYGWDGTSDIWDYGPFLNYWKYSGYGGAIYCYPYSAPEFVDCNFIDNHSYGGSCGITGTLWYPTWPLHHYKIDSFGGAVYAAEGSSPVFTGCTFIGNESDVNGPSSHGRDTEIPINYDPYISYGGAIAFEDSALITFDKCTFNDNLATVGGGIWGTWSGLDISDCNFVQNTAYHGGGVYFVGGSPEIVRSDFSENKALYDTSTVRPDDPNVILIYGEGGAIHVFDADATIIDCDMANNNAGGSGGGIYISGSSKPLVRNCLITGNFARRDGGGISASSDVNIVNCTIADNAVTVRGTDIGFGGGLYCSYNGYADIINSIIWGNFGTKGAQLAISTGFKSDPRPSTADVKYSVIGPPGTDPIYVDNGCTLNGWDANAPDPNDPWNPNTHNLKIDDDPLFIAGYYLSQVAAGQHVNSPCVNTGSTLASNIGLNTYTTRTDSVPDAGIVDMGYHYSLFTVPQYQLTFETNGVSVIEPNIYDPNYDGFYNWYTTVPLKIGTYDANYYRVWWTGTDDDSIGGPNNAVTMDGDKLVTIRLVKAKYDLTIRVDGGNGRLFAKWFEGKDPCEAPHTSAVNFGTVVQLRAEPNEGFRVKRWSGTDNDASRDPNNTVTMNFDRTVHVEFGPPTTITVPTDYSSIQQALDAAEEGDTILIAPGTYTTSTGYLIQNKAVTISGIAPDDPCVVAATVINMRIGGEGYTVPRAFVFSNVSLEAVLNGITIRGFTYRAYNGLDAEETGEDGQNGMHAFGGGIICYMASPTIKNCIIADCNVIGGSGGNGFNGSGSEQDDPNIHGTDGGWPGRAYGGGLACIVNSSPVVVNCTFQNCGAIGGNGGDGGNGATSEDFYAYGGRGGGWYYGEGSLWFNVPWDRSSQGYEREGPVRNSFYDFYTEYTARGGAVFIGEQCSPVFTHCTFTNNRTEGGTCGICGLDGFPPVNRREPSFHWEIENFGGAVYCETNSSPTFIGCTFTGNTADVNYPNYNDDPYVSYGGAVAWETDVNVVFEDCTFNDNLASIGGAMYGEWANPSIVDCNLTANTAYHGGGLYFVGGAPEITRSDFSENEALYNTSIAGPNIVEVLGEGGAIHCFDTDVTIIDCNIFNNDAAGSGGGIYMTGRPLVKNCLITGNIAGKDGGGISANWHSDSNIVNCTIVGNRVTGSGFGTGYGGGLSCSYNSYVNIINSIIWDNLGSIRAQGSQLAIATGFKYDPRPSTLNVTYSDIQDATDPNAFGQRMDTLDLVFCIDTTGSMGDDINAVRAAARQITNAIATQIPDFRIAVVDYKDFNTAPYGGNTDYPYRTDLGFTTDTNKVIAAINLLTASGGGDTPESVYTAVMHCIDHNSLAANLGGQLHGADPNSRGPGAWRPGNVMRVIILMGDAPPHDPEPFTDYTVDDIADAAGGIEPKHIVPVLIGQDAAAGNYFRSLAAETGGTVLQAAGAGQVVGALMDAIDMISQIPDPIFLEANCVFNWDPNSHNWSPGSHNIDEDPCFVAGYFLSQIAAGQRVNSPCVNTGSTLASNIGLNTYTTRTDSVSDAGIVDMGYHYNPFTVPQYKLTINATGVDVIEPNIYAPGYNGLFNWYTTVRLRVGGYDANSYRVLWTSTDNDDITGPNNTITMNGDKVVAVRLVKTKYDLTIEVAGGNGGLSAEWAEDSNTYTINAPRTNQPVRFGTVVQLRAEPDEGFRVKRWIGTDDGSSRNPNNTVIINSDRAVRVEFGLPVVVAVPQDYATIQDAISAAEEGDTVMVYPGTYYGGYEAIMLAVDKSVTIRSEHPDDPCCVAATIIDGYRRLNNYANIGVVLTANAVLNGLTIQNCGGYVGDSEDGTRTDPCHPDGWDGGCAGGAAIYIYAGTSPVIKNCIIRNNIIIGGNAGNGVAADETYNAGRGGWAGWAHGGAVYCGVETSPTFINCKILNNEARGGNGGNGGAYAENGGAANYGGNWSLIGSPVLPVFYMDPNGLGITAITDRNLWEVLEWDWASSYWPMYGQPTRTSYIGDYRWYSGYGGGVFCDANSTVAFNNCTISGNIALGGMSGQGGVMGPGGRQQEPLVPYEIPNYGGGVYCAAGASVTFSGCTITDNISSPLAYVDPNDPNSGLRHRLDPYLGHGGGVCAERTASVVFTDCTFSENEASLGGGIFWDDANAELIDSNLVDNMAYKGGGVYFNSGLAEIVQSDFSRNDANGPAGEGGGIYCSDANTMIIDCNLIHNDANSSGGGVYITDSVAWFKNCLITSNLAGRDGGGISVNLYAESLITNCTFVSNAAPGTFGEPNNTGFGGGLYCGYESNCEVNDSIFWNNLAIRGVEIAVHTSFVHDPSPSTLTISYSDVKGGQAGVQVDTGCTLNWLAGNIAIDPLFVNGLFGDYYLSQTGSGQSQNSPCVDTGSDLASNVGMVVNLLYMNGYTTRTDGGLDKGTVDMGYHYSSPIEVCGFCNFFDRALNGDPEGFIDFRDFAMFALHWLDEGCSGRNGWCGGADFTTDTVVDIFDLVGFVNCWLVEDTSAPVPNPSEWKTPPHGTTSISMEAKQAIDGWGWGVRYYFERVPLGVPNSGWQSSPVWTDTSVVQGIVYGYRVKTRDELGNEGEWSEIGYGGEQDTTPPAPEPYINSIVPSSTTITMTSTISHDYSGDEYIEYYFDTNTPGAHDSGWISDNNYVDVNLVPSTQYAYRVQARDRYNNTTNWSAWVRVTTLAPPDGTAPTPNPMQWDSQGGPNGDPNGYPRLRNYGGGPFDNWVEMRAAVATDPSGVWYKFVCHSDGGYTSGGTWDQAHPGYNGGVEWRTADNVPDGVDPREYIVNIGNPNSTEWYVLARDDYWNITIEPAHWWAR